MNLEKLFVRTAFAMILAVMFSACSSSSDNEQVAIQGTGGNPDDAMGGIGITEDNYDMFLREAVDAINLAALTADAEKVSVLAREILAGHNTAALGALGLALISEEIFDGGTNQQYSCNAGGTLSFPVHDNLGTEAKWELSFDKCFVVSILYDGDFAEQSGREVSSLEFNDFSATFADGSKFAIDGEYSLVKSRGAIVNRESWEKTDYVKTDSSGAEWRLLNLTRESKVKIFQNLSENSPSGYVALSDGTVGLASPFDNEASVVTDFDLDSASSQLGLIKISSDLSFDGNHYIWNTANPDERPNFVVPAFPVSDLGFPLLVDGAGGIGSFSIDSKPAVQEGSEQWNNGSLTVVAADGSHVVMSPSADDLAMVDVQINESSEIVMRAWSEGLQVSCQQFTGCQ